MVCINYSCQPKGSCSAPGDCDDTWCCDKDPTLPSTCQGAGSCVERGTRRCNNKYLCDPPEGFVSSANKKLSLLDFLLNFNLFSKVFS